MWYLARMSVMVALVCVIAILSINGAVFAADVGTATVTVNVGSDFWDTFINGSKPNDVGMNILDSAGNKLTANRNMYPKASSLSSSVTTTIGAKFRVRIWVDRGNSNLFVYDEVITNTGERKTIDLDSLIPDSAKAMTTTVTIVFIDHFWDTFINGSKPDSFGMDCWSTGGKRLTNDKVAETGAFSLSAAVTTAKDARVKVHTWVKKNNSVLAEKDLYITNIGGNKIIRWE